MPNNMGAQHIASAKGGFEPLRQFDWLFEIYLDSFDDEETLTLSLESGFTPNDSNEVIDVHYLNEKIKVAGKAMYEDGTVTYKDFVDRDTYAALTRWRRLVWNPETGVIGYAADYKKDGKLLILGPDGTVVKEWLVEGAWCSALSQIPLSMDTSDILKVEATITYDRAYFTNVDQRGSSVFGGI